MQGIKCREIRKTGNKDRRIITMEKIKMTTPLVEMDGDEMTKNSLAI